jgi:hypothetical protein
MKLDPGMHIGMHLVFFGKAGVTAMHGSARRSFTTANSGEHMRAM